MGTHVALVAFAVVQPVLDDVGWIAWGAVPTDRPVGDQAEHRWNDLVGLWCDLTRGGCGPGPAAHPVAGDPRLRPRRPH